MKKHFLTTLACTLAISFSPISSAQISIGKFDLGKGLQALKGVKDANTELTEAQEVALGQDITSKLLGMVALDPDQDLQAYVNKVGKWVSLHSERPDLPWTFAVLNDNDANAFAAPGGYILVSKGLLTQMKSEAELAGVLGHEIAHVIRKHHLNAIKKAGAMAAAQGIGSAIVSAKGGDERVLKFAAGFNELYTRGLDKDDEFEADRMGVVLAARAGYDPYGLPALLQTLQTVDPKSLGFALLFETHPRLSDRLELLEKVMSTGFDNADNQASVTERFNRAMKRPTEEPVTKPTKPTTTETPATKPTKAKKTK